MKNRITGWMLGVIVCLVITGCHQKPESEPIPMEAAVYCRFDNIQNSWTTLSEREFMRRSAQWKIWSEPWMRDALKPLKALRTDFEKDTGVPLNEDTIMMLFGRRVDLVMLPDQPLPSILLISELGKNSAALKIVSRAIESLQKDRVSTYDYQDITITAVKAGNDVIPDTPSVQEIVYCFADERIFASTNRSALERFLTLRETPEQTLRDTAVFRETVKMLNMPANLVYTQPNRVMEIASAVGESYGAGAGISNLKADIWAAGLTVTDNGVTFDTALKPPHDDVERWEKIYRNPDAVERSGRWLSSNCIAGSVAGIDIPGLMEHQKSILSTIDDPEGMDMWTKLTGGLQEITGMDIPGELTLWGGKGMFFTMENIRMVSLIPIPDLAFGINVRDRAAAGEFVKAMQKRVEEAAGPDYGSFSQETLVNNYVYHFLPIPLIPGFQPGFALCDDYLLFGTSSDTVDQSLKTFSGKDPGLLDNPSMEPLIAMGVKDLIAYQTFDPPKFSSVAKTALDGISLFLVAANQKPEIYREVLDTLDTVPLVAFRLTLKDNMLVYNGLVEMR
ncbi:hypothetical protein JW823_01735 [bacterium]|nr:hypothetical protein [candidate division CSSED10-310 bacterium]